MKINALKKTLLTLGFGMGIGMSAIGSASAGSICPLWEMQCAANNNAACLSWALMCAPDAE